MSLTAALHLFEGYGIEIEYMIVDRDTLAVRPIADAVLRAQAGGEQVNEVEVGDLCWSNELVLHVLELKTNGPTPTLHGAAGRFQEHVRRVDALLEPMGARLMPTGMHPLMDPATEARLWPHDDQTIYRAFDRIFDCRGHGWSNLQSVHLNLPFQGDEEFGRLHAAIRVLLPLMPALSASSPVREGAPTGLLDTRLEVYRHNCARVPSVSGEVVPEPVFTRAAYEGELLAGLYRAIAPHDPDGILQFEWLNARGAIARFDRDAIEIRVLDVQECPAADVAVLTAIAAALRALVDGRLGSLAAQQAEPVAPLARILLDVIRDGERAVVRDRAYLELLGIEGGAASVGEIWHQLVARHAPDTPPDPEVARALALILDRGPLARRIGRALGPTPTRAQVLDVYGELAEHLHRGTPWAGPQT